MYGTNSLLWVVRQENGIRWILFRDELRKRRDNFCMRLARALPKRLVFFCFIQVFGEATMTPPLSTVHVDKLTIPEVTKAFTEKYGI